MRDSRTGGNRLVLLGGILVTAFVLVGFGATAMAQEQQQEQPKTQVKEEVVVTGTLIPRPTLEAMSPVSTLEVEELTYRGVTRLEDLLTTLPQIYVADNSSISNGTTGTATIDLRNMGSQRTLILINGRRIQGGDPLAISPDINFIPTMLLKRVDVLTGGASATYGADAVAGVVNFILDKDFEGFRGGFEGGGYQHNNRNDIAQAANASRGFPYPTGSGWDGGNFDAYAALGSKFGEGKGSASAYIDYRKTAQLLKKRRDYTTCDFSTAGPTGPRCGGSGTVPWTRITAYDENWDLVGDYAIDRSGPGNTMVPYTGTTDRYNFAPLNMMQRPDTRFAAGGFVTYEWNPHYVGYIEAMLMDDTNDAQIAPSGLFYGSQQNWPADYHINCNNPMLSADQYQKICANAGFGRDDMANVFIGKRSIESGGRRDVINHQAYRLVAGLKGEIDRAWNYDVFGLQGVSRLSENYTKDFNSTHVMDALIVDGDPNDPSTWHCRSGNPGCVPWNLFKYPANPSQATLDYLLIPLLSTGEMKTQQVEGKATADLGEYGWTFGSATEGIRLALGASYRKEFLTLDYDLAYQQGIASGQGGSGRVPVSGMYDAKEYFAEVRIPFIQGVRGAQDLSMELGYRSSTYGVDPNPTGQGGGTFPTYKIQASYAPMLALKFRAGVNRATRAPNAGELFTPQVVTIQGNQDPCAGSSPVYTQAQCVNTGMTAAQYGHTLANSAQQYYGQTGGNPNLNPEIADTQTLGIVITPGSFTIAFDWYDIKMTDTIGSLGFNEILNTCAITGDPTLCALVHRDSLGTLWMTSDGYVVMSNANIGKMHNQGVDANLTWALPAGQSLFSFNLIGTYLMNNTLENPLIQYDCQGYYGDTCLIPNPDWRHMFRATWETGPVALTFAWRYIGGVMHDSRNPSETLYNPDLWNRLKLNDAYEIPAYNFYDLAFAYRFGSAVTFNFGVNNIMDTEPPLGSGYANTGYQAGIYGTYDPYGRYVHSSIQFTF